MVALFKKIYHCPFFLCSRKSFGSSVAQGMHNGTWTIYQFLPSKYCRSLSYGCLLWYKLGLDGCDRSQPKQQPMVPPLASLAINSQYLFNICPWKTLALWLIPLVGSRKQWTNARVNTTSLSKLKFSGTRINISSACLSFWYLFLDQWPSTLGYVEKVDLSDSSIFLRNIPSYKGDGRLTYIICTALVTLAKLQ